MSPFYAGLLIGFFLGGFSGLVLICALVLSREREREWHDRSDR